MGKGKREVSPVDQQSTRGKDGTAAFPFHFPATLCGGSVDLAGILRIVVLVLSTGAMLAGIAVMMGILVPRTMPEQFRFMIGIVIFLYGAYRFVVGYYRKKDES